MTQHQKIEKKKSLVKTSNHNFQVQIPPPTSPQGFWWKTLTLKQTSRLRKKTLSERDTHTQREKPSALIHNTKRSKRVWLPVPLPFTLWAWEGNGDGIRYGNDDDGDHVAAAFLLLLLHPHVAYCGPLGLLQQQQQQQLLITLQGRPFQRKFILVVVVEVVFLHVLFWCGKGGALGMHVICIYAGEKERKTERGDGDGLMPSVGYNIL